MENRMNYIANLKNCISSRNSFAALTQTTVTQQTFLIDNMEYQVIRQQIKDSHYYNKTTKHVRIRLEKWLSYLDKIKTNKVWVKSRNTYVKILNLMCYCECIHAPFNQLPPDDQLPTLSKNQVNRIIDQIERQLKSSTVTSRRASQNIEINKQLVQNEMENIIFPTFSQQQRRFQTNQSNSFLEDQFSTLPLKVTQFNTKKRFETEVQQSTVPLKISKQSQYENSFHYIQSRQRSEVSQVDSISERRFSLSTKRNSKQHVGKQNTVCQDTLASINSHQKIRKNTLTPTKTIVLKQIKLNDIKRPNIPLKLKNIPQKFKEQQKLKEDSIPREYWQQNSLLSRGQSNQNTPKYINNYTSQHAVSEECVQIMSFRQKEGEICDCTSKMLGGGWFSELFKKINI